MKEKEEESITTQHNLMQKCNQLPSNSSLFGTLVHFVYRTVDSYFDTVKLYVAECIVYDDGLTCFAFELNR